MSIYLNTLLGLALSACAGIVSASSATQVSQIILLQDDAATRVFVEISQQSTYKAFLLKGPDRAVLDIEGAEFGAQFKLPGANGAVLAVRQGKTPTGLRVVFDLAQAAKLSDRVDVSGAKPRLVLEIMPASPDQVSR
ncbi:AMIN domain-containing protein, partial [Arenimonas sp.]|uniref:AMIN domain-containing protein n=1 Tax=Arenimonas sp. TaxID=1872635 RepID=UPI0037BF720E